MHCRFDYRPLRTPAIHWSWY